MKLAQRILDIKPSITTNVAVRARTLREQGIDIISLDTGEPDFDTSQHIKDAAIQAMASGKTKYTPVDGTGELKKAVQEKFKRENNLSYDLNQIIVSSGGKHSIFNAIASIINPGDEVIIPAPYWVSYPDIVIAMGGKPICIETSDKQDFKLTPEQLENAITDKTQLLIINSPSNPSGSVYSRAELLALGKILLKHPQILVLTDDIYEHIYWAKEPFANIVNACPELYDRTIVMNGVSKAYAMTGWRIGFVGGPKEIVNAMRTFQSQSTSCACSISQAAATAALTGDQSFIKNMTKAFKERHDYLIPELNKIEGLSCKPADGAFYIFANVEGVIERLPDINNDLELSEFLLQKARVSLVPGSGFGLPGYIRISYATSMENLKKSMARMQEALK